MAKILCVEDRESILEALEEKLELAGHSVVGVTNIAGAKKAFKTQRPDIMILDYRLMNNDTGERTDTIKGFLKKLGDKRGDIPVLILSATALEDIKKENPDFDDLKLEFLSKENKFEVNSMVVVDKIKGMLRATKTSINNKGEGKSPS